ncbi:hypothetical protein ESA94_01875 [Lacibacter luteus]|uniref:Uncharacterized protein n=1 Tax=Lacibacter luteus TaxID=2508719 RepID=A0A4Q1CLY9_9BACT|nr:hypothetical protein [Lacibacter luteus]RXK61784.1 hypothetical protein ESA94_01875 [Lacibacter luteus]
MNLQKQSKNRFSIKTLQVLFLLMISISSIITSCQKSSLEEKHQAKDELVQSPGEESTDIFDVECHEVNDYTWELKQNQYGQWYAAYTNVSYTVCRSVSPSSGTAPPNGSGGTALWGTNTSTFNSLNGSSISSIHDYFKCLDPNSSATITVYVDQPTANTDQLWQDLGSSTANVGDVFIEIQQGSYTRVFGFYPSSPVNENSTQTATGVLLDKSNKSYDVALTFGVNSTQFANILNYARHSLTVFPTYHFFYNNNVDYAVNILLLGGLPINKPYAYWPNIGTINSAGLLGEILKETQVNSAILTQGGSSNSFSTTCP